MVVCKSNISCVSNENFPSESNQKNWKKCHFTSCFWLQMSLESKEEMKSSYFAGKQQKNLYDDRLKWTQVVSIDIK